MQRPRIRLPQLNVHPVVMKRTGPYSWWTGSAGFVDIGAIAQHELYNIWMASRACMQQICLRYIRSVFKQELRDFHSTAVNGSAQRCNIPLPRWTGTRTEVA
eukprot:TRINITY_DN11435_c0_g1_i16.p5 TRINITY_DN11435_c0_g1~~TRINITY_DN11435_c0_g1_i16.p5  ORF type:complete len:102 (-),score=2.92 TRINITY_DN11435_c0_g1_i16:1945-2250(-)